NGGPTYTLALLPGSPALDAGDDSLLAAPFNLATDQRGYPRKAGAHVDVGAFEFQPASAAFYLSISNPALASNNPLQLAFTNSTGATFAMLTCTNLSLPASNWTILGAATEIGPGQFHFTDMTATNGQRFYQARSP